nr:uncharacterized protein LOC126531931 isoform X3 [Dermacentor andersoni]
MKARIENGVVYSPFPSVDIPLCSAYTLIKEALSKSPERVALVEGSVRTTRGALLALMESYAAGFQQHGVGPGDRVCTHLKNGLENLAAMYGCIFAGATLVLAKTSLTQKELRGQIMDSDSTHVLTDVELTEKVKKATSNLELKTTSMFTFPTRLHALIEEMLRTGERLKSFRRIGVGGGALPQATYDAAFKAFANLECIVNMYAMTESGGLVCSPSMRSAKGTDMGFPAVMTEVKVVDPVTRMKLGPNETGEICFRNPMVMRGYYKRPKETAEFFEGNGWCRSGDAGYYDEDGRFHFIQRMKELIKCIDNQVVPAELEQLLLQEHPADIAEVAVVGIPHSQYGEAPAAAVVLKEKPTTCSTSELTDKIKRTIAEKLAVHKQLYGGVFFLDFLPKNEMGKINRKALVEQCAAKICL